MQGTSVRVERGDRKQAAPGSGKPAQFETELDVGRSFPRRRFPRYLWTSTRLAVGERNDVRNELSVTLRGGGDVRHARRQIHDWSQCRAEAEPVDMDP